MKQFIAFVKKEFHHILRDRRTMLILIGMPIVQIILFGFAISTEVRNVQTAILTSSVNSDTRHIIDRLDASEYFTVKYVVHTNEELNQLFRKGKIELGIAFPRELQRQRFDSESIQIIADATDPNLAITRGSYANGIIATAAAELRQAGIQHPSIVMHTKLLYNPQMRSAYNFVPGVMGLILMLICAMMTSISIVREKETGTMEILLVSPMNSLFVILSKAVPYFVLSILNLTTILLLSFFVPGCPDRRKSHGSGRCVTRIHLCVARPRIVDFQRNADTSCRHAGLRNGADAPHDYSIGDYLPDREHARHITGYFMFHPGTLVCQHRPQNHDRGSSIHVRVEGNRNTTFHGRGTHRDHDPNIQKRLE